MTYKELLDDTKQQIDTVTLGREYDDCSIEEQNEIDRIISFQSWKLRYSHNELSLPLSSYVRV